MANCPECGAPSVDGLTCWEQFTWLLGWEAQDEALRAIHFVTAASYNLQHPAQFTDEALAGMRDAFIEHLDHGLSVSEIRRRVGKAAAGKQRVIKKEAERQPRLREWSMTVADVYLPDRPEGAADRVRAWAAAIRNEL